MNLFSGLQNTASFKLEKNCLENFFLKNTRELKTFHVKRKN